MSTSLFTTAPFTTALWISALFGVGATLTGLALRAALGWGVVERLHPRTRARWLAWCAALPVIVGAGLVAATFVPQTWLGLPDHCLEGHGHLHLCLDCGLPHPPTPVTLFAVFFAGWTLFRLTRVGAQLGRAHRALSRLARVETGGEVRDEGRDEARDEGLSLLPIPGPVAFVAGFVRPRVYVSPEVRHPRWRAVLAHERDHARHRDPLARLLCRLALAVAPPGVAGWLEGRLVRAQELAADEAAAIELGDRIEVAEQVLAWARRQRLDTPLSAVFGGGEVDERVQTLLDAPRYLAGPSRGQLASFGTVGAALVLPLVPSIHHVVEETAHLLLGH